MILFLLLCTPDISLCHFWSCGVVYWSWLDADIGIGLLLHDGGKNQLSAGRQEVNTLGLSAETPHTSKTAFLLAEEHVWSTFKWYLQIKWLVVCYTYLQLHPAGHSVSDWLIYTWLLMDNFSSMRHCPGGLLVSVGCWVTEQREVLSQCVWACSGSGLTV